MSDNTKIAKLEEDIMFFRMYYSEKDKWCL